MSYPLYFVSPVISAILSTLIVAYSWHHRERKSAPHFANMMLAVSIWSWGFALQLLSPTELVARILDKAYFFGIILLPVAWLVFAFSYTGRQKWLSSQVLLLIAIIPILSLFINWTDDLHHLFFGEIQFQRHGIFLIPNRTNGVWFYVHAIYSYTLITIGMYLFIRHAVRSFQVYRLQALALIIGAIAPLIPNILVTVQWVEIPITFVGFTVMGLIYGWALFRYQLLDLVPVARETLIDSMNDGMLVLDAQGRILDFNPVTEDILGFDADTVIGQTIDETFENRARLLPYLAAQQEHQVEVEIPVNGKSRHYDLQISLLRDYREQTTGRLILFHDITKRKKSEQALRQYTAELEASNAELDAFAHTVAHDLKTPLTVLIGFAGMVEAQYEHLSAEKLTYNVKTIAQNARKMSNIIDELLLLASVRKVEEVEIRPLNMKRIVTGTLARLNDMIARYDGDVILPDAWPAARGYGPWIEEVWVNYISNALKYGGEPPRIELGATVQNGYVRFWVRDNGPGIPKSELDKLFTQFERLGKKRVEGHGLGLSIVQRIMSKLNGEVGVESTVGEGSLFWFSLAACPTPKESH